MSFSFLVISETDEYYVPATQTQKEKGDENLEDSPPERLLSDPCLFVPETQDTSVCTCTFAPFIMIME